MQRLFLLLLCFAMGKINAQDSGLIIGKWLKTPKEDVIIEVYKVEDQFKGKITWVKDKTKTKEVGFQIMEGLIYDADEKEWSNGKIHNPASGSTYSAVAKILPDGTLEVLAYKGMKFIGRKKYFKRVE